jgi:hypothetical protein
MRQFPIFQTHNRTSTIYIHTPPHNSNTYYPQTKLIDYNDI